MSEEFEVNINEQDGRDIANQLCGYNQALKDVEKLINSLHITGGMTHFNLSEEHWISKEELKQKLKELGR